MKPMFVVKKVGRRMRIEWHLPGIDDPASFLYWAYEWSAVYRIEKAGFPGAPLPEGWLEFIAVDGVIGEYNRWLYWDYRPWRAGFTGTHKLTQHGLDGLPRAFFYTLPQEDTIFRVETGEGAFMLTVSDWIRYFVSGRDSTNLIDLGTVAR